MRNRAINVLAGLTIGASVATLVTLSTPPTVVGTAHAQPQEDEPGWDCATMGNRVCGPQDGVLAYWEDEYGCGWIVLPAAPPDYPTAAIEPAGCN